MAIRFSKMQNVIDFTHVLHFLLLLEIFVEIIICGNSRLVPLKVMWCYAVIRSNKNFHDPRKWLGTFDGQYYRFPYHFGSAFIFYAKCQYKASPKHTIISYLYIVCGTHSLTRIIYFCSKYISVNFFFLVKTIYFFPDEDNLLLSNTYK